MTDTELQAIRELADKATPGPWEHGQSVSGSHNIHKEESDVTHPEAWLSAADADFIARAREAVPALLEEVAAIRRFKPTAEGINALPPPLLQFIHDLETRADPAGEVQERAALRENCGALEILLEAAKAEAARLREALNGVKECLRAADNRFSVPAEVVGATRIINAALAAPPAAPS